MSLIKTNLKSDIVAGVVVSLIAIPLCLGIARASGMPPFSGMIAGIVGGIVIGYISKSPLSVSGPAAGLITIIATGISDMGIEGVLLASIIGGLFQISLYFFRAGGIAYYFPSRVIEGMLTAIGITIILKNLPVLLGFPQIMNNEAPVYYIQKVVSDMEDQINWIAMATGISALLAMIAWDKFKPQALKVFPGALIAVIVGIAGYGFSQTQTIGSFSSTDLVELPIIDSFSSFTHLFIFPDFGRILDSKVWVLGTTIGLVASIETLLTIEATDKIDPLKRVTPTNRELLAQGIGNSLSGLLGGLPVTSVIVRSKANIDAGGRTKTATITHGIILLLGILIIPQLLNMIPLSSLAAILVVTGYKLANPFLIKKGFSLSKHQWIPFVITIVAVLYTDLLRGVGLGMLAAIYFILRGNMKSCYDLYYELRDGKPFYHIELSQEISFLKKATMIKTLSRIPRNSQVIIDAKKTIYIDFDVLELIKEFKDTTAPFKNIQLELINFKEAYQIESKYGVQVQHLKPHKTSI
ncbi:MAG: SulP family inorganic anion transporter [Flavobacteriaceae bacterium]|jgi:carbonic anhydrase|nr:SulP family inorganic anion transporter [Flavobacteriaceae bacterium]